MKKAFSLFLLLFLVFQQTFSQKPTFPTTFYQLGYHGNLLTNPGVSGGLEWAFYENIKTKSSVKRNGRKVKYKTNRLELNPSLGVFFDPNTQTTTFINLTTQFKRIDNKGKNYTVGVGFGYLTNIIKDVYTIQNGVVEQSKFQLKGYLAPSISVGIGKIKLKKESNGWYSTLKTQFLLNYNGGILPLPGLEIGKRF